MRNWIHRLRLGRGEFWALAGALFYSLSNVFTGVAVRGAELNYLVGVSLRVLPMLVLSIVAIWLRRDRQSNSISLLSHGKVLATLVASGLLTYTIGSPLLFAALRYGGVLVSSPITGTQVLWSAIFAALLLRQPFNTRMALGMLASLVGVVLLTVGRSGSLDLPPRWWLAVPYATGSAFSWALSGVLISYAMRRGVDRFRALNISVLTGAITLNGYLLLTGDIGLYLSTPWNIMASAALAGVLGMVGLFSLTSALALTTVASASTLNSLQVGLAPLIAWLFLGEGMNQWMALGILLIMGGVIVVQVSKG
ncbi:MAG: DMT family transporter [Anaerolineae bacterium]